VFVATKCWFLTGDDANASGHSQKRITDVCYASVMRMRVDYVDLSQIHGPDPDTGLAHGSDAVGVRVSEGLDGHEMPGTLKFAEFSPNHVTRRP
jgi:1-deoxyxylulose-5-phosphate synthase